MPTLQSARPSTGPDAGAPAGTPPTAPARRARTVSGSTARSRILVTTALVVAAVYFLVPVYWLVVSSTKSTADLFGTFGFALGDMNLMSNLRQLFTQDGGVFARWLLNSAIYSVGGAAGATVLASMAGYVLAKFHFRGRNAVFAVVLGGVMIPGAALALPLYFMFAAAGMSNTYWAVLLPSMVSPFAVYLCRIYADASVPDELLEAARLDGSGELRTFWQVVQPTMVPVLVTVFLFELVNSWNNFLLPLIMLSDTELFPLTVGLNSWYSTASRVPEMFQLTVTGSLVSVVPLMIAMVFLQRFWKMGLTEGSVKQ